MLANVLDLSNAHVPGPTPNWGRVRVVEHEFGWIVFISGDLGDREARRTVPDWMLGIWKHAVKENCIAVIFDRDADVDDRFLKFNW